MELRILPISEDVKKMYESHGTFHEGDSGLDLFCPREITVEPGQTVFVDLDIRCEALIDDKNVSYYNIPDLIGFICLSYYRNVYIFMNHL